MRRHHPAMIAFATALCLAAAGCQSCAATAGCQSDPVEGEYVTFVREMMIASGRLDDLAGQGAERSEAATRAVTVWRGEED